MTVRTKQYVNIEDILGIRLECPNCFTALDLPMTRTGSGMPMTCPNCRIEWFDQHQNPNVGIAVERFVDSYKTLKRQIADDAKVKKTVDITLETTPPKASG